MAAKGFSSFALEPFSLHLYPLFPAGYFGSFSEGKGWLWLI
jgi:hypothetical protein